MATNKFGQNSILDYLLEKMPELSFIKNKLVDENSAKELFLIWENPNSKIGKTTYKKPQNISSNSVENLQKQGLVRRIGDAIEITAKGNEVIKTMILGDERSIFEDDGKPLPYKMALANTKRKKIKNGKKYQEQWWSRF
jgi:hypothetical protein